MKNVFQASRRGSHQVHVTAPSRGKMEWLMRNAHYSMIESWSRQRDGSWVATISREFPEYHTQDFADAINACDYPSSDQPSAVSGQRSAISGPREVCGDLIVRARNTSMWAYPLTFLAVVWIVVVSVLGVMDAGWFCTPPVALVLMGALAQMWKEGGA